MKMEKVFCVFGERHAKTYGTDARRLHYFLDDALIASGATVSTLGLVDGDARAVVVKLFVSVREGAAADRDAPTNGRNVVAPSAASAPCPFKCAERRCRRHRHIPRLHISSR